VQQMAHYLALFWVKVHETQAPAVHRASFRPDKAPTPLLLGMMLLGSYFAPPESYQLAVQLHPWFRGKVLCVRLSYLSLVLPSAQTDGCRACTVARLPPEVRDLVNADHAPHHRLRQALQQCVSPS